MNTIDTNSWHWLYATRFGGKICGRAQISICQYFWSVVVGIVLTGVVMFIASGIVVWGAFHIVSFWEFGRLAYQPDDLGVFAMVSFVSTTAIFLLAAFVAAIASVFATLGIIVIAGVWVVNKCVGDDTIVVEYLKAKKNNWCPMLTINYNTKGKIKP